MLELLQVPILCMFFVLGSCSDSGGLSDDPKYKERVDRYWGRISLKGVDDKDAKSGEVVYSWSNGRLFAKKQHIDGVPVDSAFYYLNVDKYSMVEYISDGLVGFARIDFCDSSSRSRVVTYDASQGMVVVYGTGSSVFSFNVAAQVSARTGPCFFIQQNKLILRTDCGPVVVDLMGGNLVLSVPDSINSYCALDKKEMGERCIWQWIDKGDSVQFTSYDDARDMNLCLSMTSYLPEWTPR